MYNNVPVQKCKDVTGKMQINVRSVDRNKQGETNLRYRCRLGAKEYKRYNDPDPSSSTSPIEMLRYIVSRAAKGKSRKENIRHVVANDVARAFFDGPSTPPVFVELCAEDRRLEDEGRCDELSVSMYGTRTAALNWQKRYTDLLCNCGFRVTRGNTYMF